MAETPWQQQGYSALRRWAAVVNYSRRGGVQSCDRLCEVLIRERMWAFPTVPDYRTTKLASSSSNSWVLQQVWGEGGGREQWKCGEFEGHFPQYVKRSLILYFLTLNSPWPEEFSPFLRYLHDVLCVKDKKRAIANFADGWIADYLTSAYRSCAIICSCLSQVPHHVPLTEFVRPLIPAAVEKCCLSPPEWSALTVRASQTIKGFLFPSYDLSTSLTSSCQV